MKDLYFFYSLSHDNGISYGKATGPSATALIKRLCNLELCPEGAVNVIEVTKDQYNGQRSIRAVIKSNTNLTPLKI